MTLWDWITGIATIGLVAALVDGAGKERDRFNYMRGYVDALADLERATR